jgi:hypothetical protein
MVASPAAATTQTTSDGTGDIAIAPLQALRLQGSRLLCAASGLVCAHDRAYVVGDDDLHLSVFSQAHATGQRHRLRAGRLPNQAAARKKAKPDFECLMLWPRASCFQGGDALVCLGSGSRPTRCDAVVMPLNADGTPGTAHAPVDLAPLYAPLRARHGALNVEGAFLWGPSFVLLNRGLPGEAPYAAFYFDAHAVGALLFEGARQDVLPTRMQLFGLGAIDGVPLAFTDGKALPPAHGGWLFCAAAEDRSNSYDDGGCRGSALGVIDANGRLAMLRRIDASAKVEGIDWRLEPDGSLSVFMVTDADDAHQAAWLLSTRLEVPTS